MIQIAGWLKVLGTIAALYMAVQSWRAAQRCLAARITATVVALAFIGVVWFVFTWNLLN